MLSVGRLVCVVHLQGCALKHCTATRKSHPFCSAPDRTAPNSSEVFPVPGDRLLHLTSPGLRTTCCPPTWCPRQSLTYPGLWGAAVLQEESRGSLRS